MASELFPMTCRIEELINHDDFDQLITHTAQLQALIKGGYTKEEVRDHLYFLLDGYKAKKAAVLVDRTLDLLYIIDHPRFLTEPDRGATGVEEETVVPDTFGYCESEEWLESLYKRKESLRVSSLMVDEEIERVNEAILRRAEGKLEVIKTLLNEGVWACKCASKPERGSS